MTKKRTRLTNHCRYSRATSSREATSQSAAEDRLGFSGDEEAEAAVAEEAAAEEAAEVRPVGREEEAEAHETRRTLRRDTTE